MKEYVDSRALKGFFLFALTDNLYSLPIDVLAKKILTVVDSSHRYKVPKGPSPHPLGRRGF